MFVTLSDTWGFRECSFEVLLCSRSYFEKSQELIDKKKGQQQPLLLPFLQQSSPEIGGELSERVVVGGVKMERAFPPRVSMIPASSKRFK